MERMDTMTIDLSGSPVRGDTLEAEVQLEHPLRRLTAVLPPGKAERAEAITGEGRFGAKHYWQEKPGVMQYEFDGPLPAGPVVVRIPFTRG